MVHYNELIVSASDAEVLASVVGERARSNSLEAEAASELADVLLGARLVAHEKLPADRVRMNSRVSYREEPSATFRSVTVVHPADADAAAGRVSVLSPIGRALIGREAGALIAASVPGGRGLNIRILHVDEPAAVEAP